ncbi:MAG TPA: SPASM domain-containing protein [Bacillota bacterium]|nr:SPASM domain-containing protein [Bacillota bacterium]
MFDLSETKILTFEIGARCNLEKVHKKCPINSRIAHQEFGSLSIPDVVKAVQEAKELNFKGAVAFHYYNEPLLYRDKMLAIMDCLPDTKFLLWTNGLLLRSPENENDFLRRFYFIVITCYFPEMMPKFEMLKEHFGNIEIGQWELDERKAIYTSEHKNHCGCHRMIHEIPIDYWGNLHLCCIDWNGTYQIGNIKQSGLGSVIRGEFYQKAVNSMYDDYLDETNSPHICKMCPTPKLVSPFIIE